VVPRLPVRTAGQFGEDDFHARHSRASVAKSKRADVPDELCKKPQKMLRRQWSMLRSRLGKTLAVALAVDRICPCFVLYLF